MKLVDNAICLYCRETAIFSYYVLKKTISGIHFSSGGIIWETSRAHHSVNAWKRTYCLRSKPRGHTHSSEYVYSDSHIYCQRIHHENEINLCQYIIELKNKLTIERYICTLSMANLRFISLIIIILLNSFLDFSYLYMFLLYDHNLGFNGSLCYTAS